MTNSKQLIYMHFGEINYLVSTPITDTHGGPEGPTLAPQGGCPGPECERSESARVALVFFVRFAIVK